MKFTPRPENDFGRFIDLYYAECRTRVPQIAAIAGKWRFEDLIPGLSDFDTRFIVEDSMTVGDWCAMSTAVGEVHLDLCRRFPHWARNLEHLPGINLTWDELADPGTYYAEYPQWTFYRTTAPARLKAAEEYLAARPWDRQDEYFHLKKFCLYYGRYNRAIDPPVNIGPYENKYPLHSRFMHYFCPPLQSALSILRRGPVRGKMETVRLACDMFGRGVFREMADAVARHYEMPELYEEPALTHLEDRLEQALDMLRERIAPELTLIPNAPAKSMSEWRACLNDVRLDPYPRIFDGAKFSRLMKGRLAFYARVPRHFDSVWCIENELRRLRRNFFEIPFGVYWETVTGQMPENPAEVVPQLCPSLLTQDEVRCVQEFVRLLPGHWDPGTQKDIALAIADVFDGFFSALTKIALEARRMSPALPEQAQEKDRCR